MNTTSTLLTPSNLRYHALALVFLILYLTSKINITEAGFMIPIAHVCIINDLRDGMNLTTHCKSKNDDLGVHIFPFGGNFTFSFRPGFWGTTLFYCSMEWKLSTLKYFDIYDQIRDNKKCHYCKHYDWKIKAAGPCMFNKKTNKFDICYEWNKD